MCKILTADEYLICQKFLPQIDFSTNNFDTRLSEVDADSTERPNVGRIHYTVTHYTVKEISKWVNLATLHGMQCSIVSFSCGNFYAEKSFAIWC